MNVTKVNFVFCRRGRKRNILHIWMSPPPIV